MDVGGLSFKPSQQNIFLSSTMPFKMQTRRLLVKQFLIFFLTLLHFQLILGQLAPLFLIQDIPGQVACHGTPIVTSVFHVFPLTSKSIAQKAT
jgi:hypothetical protein